MRLVVAVFVVMVVIAAVHLVIEKPVVLTSTTTD